MTTTFRKIVSPGRSTAGRLFLFIEWDGRKLSVSGVDGPTADGNARGSCGQCAEALGDLKEYAAGWDADKAKRMREIWDHWHLNNMRAGCEHQRASWDQAERIEVVKYGLSTEAYQTRTQAMERAAIAAAAGTDPKLTAEEKALILLSDWFKGRRAPDADDPLSGCFVAKKRETKAAALVYQSEHDRGLLMKPCEVCGYKYGSQWLHEEVPEDVIQWLAELPDDRNGLPRAWAR
jgi:hypothetical protein